MRRPARDNRGMATLEEAARAFLGLRRIAVVGVSRNKDATANAIYRKLRASGRTVVAVNPRADTVEGDRCVPSLAALPERPDAVLIVTAPAAIPDLVRECGALGIRDVWIHGTFGGTDIPAGAIEAARELGIRLIPGSCPLMFCEPVDPAHRCVRFVRHLFGREARPVG